MREHQIPPRLFDLCIEHITRLRGTVVCKTDWKNSVKKLPPEVLEKIFTFLSRNFRVDDGLVCTYHEYDGLEMVKLGSCSELSEIGLRSLAKCKSLKYLELARCPQVWHFFLKNILINFGYSFFALVTHFLLQITDQSLGQILAGCTTLTKLDISSNEHLTNTTMTEIGLHGANLENLNILKCTSFDERGVIQLCNCKKLKKLNMGTCSIALQSLPFSLISDMCVHTAGWCKLNDDTLYQLAQQCTRLEAMDLWLMRGVTTDGIKRVASLLTGLKKLNLWAVKVLGCLCICMMLSILICCCACTGGG